MSDPREDRNLGEGAGENGPGEPREVRHQPASLSDLRRFPPRTPECLRVREWMRDACDGELAAATRSEFEEHLHRCRDCSLAFGRAEREAMLIERAFDEERDAKAVADEGFTRRVMAEVTALMFSEQDAPPQFTGRVMERVRLEWRRVPLWRRAWLRLGAARAAVLVVGLIGLALVVGRELLRMGDPATRPDGFQVVLAEGVTRIHEDARGTETDELVVGARLHAGDQLRVARDGELQCLLESDHDLVGEPLRLRFFGGSSARLDARRGDWILFDGAVAIDAPRAFSMHVGDEHRVSFDAGGRYDVSAHRVNRFDRDIAGATVQLRVEVIEGRASVVSGDVVRGVIEAGKVALASDLEWLVEPAPRIDPLARVVGARSGRTESAPRADASHRTISVYVVDATSGRPIRGALVDLRGGEESRAPRATDAEGWVRCEVGDIHATAVTLGVVPPREEGYGFAAFGPRPVPLGNDPGSPIRIALVPDPGLRGEVLDAAGSPVAGARVTACVVDEMFGLVDRLDDRAARTGADGSFALRGMPAELDGQQALAVLVEAPGHPRLARALRRDVVGDAALRLVVPEPRRLALAGLPADRPVEILQEIPGLPLAGTSERFALATDHLGRVALDAAGPGDLWLREGADGLRRLVVDKDGVLALADGSTAARLNLQTRRLVALQSGDSATDRPQSAAVASLGTRFDRARPTAGGARVALTLRNPGAMSQRDFTRVFVEFESGEIAFLGLWDGISSLPFDPPAGRSFRIVAIGPDGSVGSLGSEDLERGDAVIALEPPGGADAASGPLSPIAGECVFELLDGPFAGQRFWRNVDFEHGVSADRLLPGTYRVTLPDGRRASCTVPAGSVGKLTPVATTTAR
ncbi:MAG: zf-HC2 domain-containing protein [Planctomycetota bacterium]